ncbi:hypothetical protein [Xanthomonas phage X1]|nr:hypothetical protein [Xanthomonas phage X1]
MTTETKTSFEAFHEQATDLYSRLALIDQLFKEADALVRNVDRSSFTDEQLDEAYELAHEIGYAAGWQFDSFGENGGYWQPSTC